MAYIPGLQLRCDPDDELLGIDETEIGQFPYDYVSLQKEIPIPVIGAAGDDGCGAEEGQDAFEMHPPAAT